MKRLITMALIWLAIGFATGAPTTHNKVDVKLEKFENNPLDASSNQYSFEYKTSDGQEREEKGTITTDENGVVKYLVKGSFLYTGPDGVYYFVSYTADENGFHPQGLHLPGATTQASVPYLHANAIKSLIG